jgi:hypothetical protein
LNQFVGETGRSGSFVGAAEGPETGIAVCEVCAGADTGEAADTGAAEDVGADPEIEAAEDGATGGADGPAGGADGPGGGAAGALNGMVAGGAVTGSIPSKGE